MQRLRGQTGKARQVDLVIRVTSLIALLIGATSLLLGYLSMRTEYHWRRDVEVVGIIRDFNKDIIPIAQSVQKHFPYHKQRVRLGPEEAKRIHDVSPEGDSATYVLRNEIIQILNYMKGVCLAYKLKTVNRDRMRDEFKPLFCNQLYCFDPFIDAAYDSYAIKTGPYDVIREVVYQWCPNIKSR